MRKWLKTLDLTSVWQNGDVPESEVHLVGKYIAKQLRKLYPDFADWDKWGSGLDDLIDRFDSILTLESYLEDPADYNYVSPFDEFNGYMSELYDFADAERLWIKTR